MRHNENPETQSWIRFYVQELLPPIQSLVLFAEAHVVLRGQGTELKAHAIPAR
jgi:hypothetical protein